MDKLIHPPATPWLTHTFSLTNQQSVTTPHPNVLLGPRLLSSKVKTSAGPEASSRQAALIHRAHCCPLCAPRPHTQTKDSVCCPTEFQSGRGGSPPCPLSICLRGSSLTWGSWLPLALSPGSCHHRHHTTTTRSRPAALTWASSQQTCGNKRKELSREASPNRLSPAQPITPGSVSSDSKTSGLFELGLSLL